MNQTIPFEEQFKIFQELGFQLNEGVTVADLKRWDEQDFLKEPFSLLYLTLGMEIEREPWTPLTNQVWYFDIECIEDQGAYVEILKRIQILSNHQLQFKNLKDEIDFAKNVATVSFELNNKDYHIKLELDDDWVDDRIFTEIVKIIKENKLDGNLTYYNTGDQCCVLGWATQNQLDNIRNKTGLDIVWLE